MTNTQKYFIYGGIALVGILAINRLVSQTENTVGTVGIAAGSAVAGVAIGYWLLPLILV